MQLSNIFEVSTDFLLKEEKSVKDAAEERGYYVSKELAKGYIANQKRISRYISIGFMAFALAGIPYNDVPCRHYLALFRAWLFAALQELSLLFLGYFLTSSNIRS